MGVSNGYPFVKLTDFHQWVTRAKGGEEYIYYTGILAFDLSAESAELLQWEKLETEKVAKAAMWLSDNNKAFLVQKRLEDGSGYEYKCIMKKAQPRDR